MSGTRASEEQSTLSKVIEFAEKDRTNVLTAFLVIFFISFVYSWLEGSVFEIPVGGLYSYSSDITFFFAVFVLGGLFLSVLSKTKIRKTFNVILIFWWIILLPPVVDKYILSGPGSGHLYLALSGMSNVFFNILFGIAGNIPLLGAGDTSLLITSLLLGMIYVGYKTHSILRSMSLFFAIPVLMVVASTHLVIEVFHGTAVLFGTFIFSLSHQYPGMSQEAVNSLGIQQWLLSITSYYLAVFFLGAALITYVKKRSLFISFWKTIRPARMAHEMAMVFVGVLVGGVLSISYPLHWPYIFLGMVSIACTWQFTTMWNDIYDITIDRISHGNRPLVSGTMGVNQYKEISFIFAIVAAGSSFLLGPVPFVLILSCLLLGYVYSAPPVRLRDKLGSPLVIGTGSFLAYLLGVFIPGSYAGFPPISRTILVVGFIIWTALSAAPIISSYEDAEGDAKSNVRSIHTVYGKAAGKRLVLIIIPMLYLLPLLLFNSVSDILLFIVFSAMGVLYFWKSDSAKPIFMLYFIELLYCMLRFLGIGM